MDTQVFNDACQLRQQGKYAEALRLFLAVADQATDRIDKAGAHLHAAKTLKLLEDYGQAKDQLSAARKLVMQYFPWKTGVDDRVRHLELYLDYEDADLLWKQGNSEQALSKFEEALRTYKARLREPDFEGFYEVMQACRAFILADLGRWEEAKPLLEEVQNSSGYKEGVAFYLGHCYLFAGDFERAEQKLAKSLELGLPTNLEYRAHGELGITYYNLREFAKAKQELEICAEKADSDYLRQSDIWKWLGETCRRLGLKDKADEYSRLATPS